MRKGVNNMASALKASIRLQKIHERNQKPHYSHLTPQEKSFVKAYEKVKQCELDMFKIGMSNPEWRKTEFGGELLGIYSKAIDKKINLSNKLGLETEAEENELYGSCHNSRFTGGSY